MFSRSNGVFGLARKFVFCAFLLVICGSANANVNWIAQSAVGYGATPREACIESGLAYKAMWAGMIMLETLPPTKIDSNTFQCWMLFNYGGVYKVRSASDRVIKTGTCNGYYDDSTGECLYEKEEECKCDTLNVLGEQFNPSTGFNTIREVDYESTDGFEIARTYNSSERMWRHNYSEKLRIADTRILIDSGSGVSSVFDRSGSAVVFKGGAPGVLEQTTSGWAFKNVNGRVLNFNNLGLLTRIDEIGRLSKTVSRQDSVVTVTDGSGLSIQIREDLLGQPISAQLSNGVAINYVLNSREKITSVKVLAGGQESTRSYHYEADSKHLLTGITDESGVRSNTWSYDDTGRLLSSERGQGVDRQEYAYGSSGNVVLKNSLGKNTTFSFQGVGGFKRLTAIDGEPSLNCPSSVSRCTYGANGILESKTDRNGFVTTYEHNARGLEVSRTEATGTPLSRTTTTEWHPIHPYPTKIVSPNRVTTFSYDSSGRPESRTVTSP